VIAEGSESPRIPRAGAPAEACRQAARDRNAGLADTDRAFHDAGKAERNPLFGFDRVHLGKPGHEVVAEAVLKAIEAAGR